MVKLNILVLISVLIIAVCPFAFADEGYVEGQGTHFNVNDNEYLNISVDSTALVDTLIIPVPDMIIIEISAMIPTTNETFLSVNKLDILPALKGCPTGKFFASRKIRDSRHEQFGVMFL